MKVLVTYKSGVQEEFLNAFRTETDRYFLSIIQATKTVRISAERISEVLETKG